MHTAVCFSFTAVLVLKYAQTSGQTGIVTILFTLFIVLYLHIIDSFVHEM